jgi:CRAL/TRIO domain
MCKVQTEQHQPRCATIVGDGGDEASRHKQVQLLLDELSPKELEVAARTNYQYYQVVSKNSPKKDADGDNERRYAAAAAMAIRYLKSKSSYDRALKGVRATVEFRAERDLDSFRSMETMDDVMRHNLSNGNAYVTGRDTSGRATVVFTPRLVEDHEASVNCLIWTMERAIACSRHGGEINAIVDFGGYDLWKHMPPMAVAKDILALLRNHYVGHVHCILFINATTSASYAWNMLKVFAGKSTKEKISFVKSSKELSNRYADDQLPRSILKAGSHPEFHAEEYFAAKYDSLQSDQ